MRRYTLILSLFALLLFACERDTLTPDRHISRNASKSVLRVTPSACPPCLGCEQDDGRPKNPGNGEDQGPEFSVLYHLVDMYEPVRFTHKAHVDYASDCVDCHHHSSEVEPTPSCRACHQLATDDIKRPGLKGAYHRQCMNCHRSMESGPLGCTECHAKREGSAADRQALLDRLNKENAPKTAVLGHLADEYEPLLFNHDLHVETADTCEACHHHSSNVERTPACRECHTQRDTRPGEAKVGLLDAYHTQCLNCHKGMEVGPQSCLSCHLKASPKNGD